MFSQISFNELYEEAELIYFNDKKLSLFALLSMGQNLGKKQIHKLLFLSFAEGKILLPFRFKKWPHGPFSVEIKDTLQELQTEKLVNEIPEQVFTKTKSTQMLSDEGKKFLEENKDKIENILKELSSTVLNYEEVKGQIQGANSLERYCYKTYFLKPDNKSDEDWEVFIRSKLSDIKLIITARENELNITEDIEETKKVLILSSLDYIGGLIEVLESSNGMDQVIRGVLIKNSQDYLDNWGEIFSLAKNNDASNLDKIRALLLENRKLFKFINESAKEYGIFESIFSGGNEVETRKSCST